MSSVVDASLVVSALVDSGPAGVWAEAQLGRTALAAPHLMLVEAANILRRSVLSGDISADAGTLAHADLVALRVELFPYEPFAPRVWELRANLTAYDAWYVALAEALGAELVTLDSRLARATGPRCTIVAPPDSVLTE
jgi:predicted nucleic acid-binding protein